MTRPVPKDLAASIRARLLANAQQDGEDFQLALLRYGNERVLARIAESPHAGKFVLKGATLFALWIDAPHRPTRDIDLLGSGANQPADLLPIFRDVCELSPVVADGLVFHADSVQAGLIREEQEYEGVRVTLLATLGNARIALQIDVGFGDATYPKPEVIALPSSLGLPTGTWRAYRRETVVAEKFHAMVVLGMGNSRMKDFFDVWTLQQRFAFDGTVLGEAIRRTFERRKTPMPANPPLALTATFATDRPKHVQWQAFLARNQLVAPELTVVIEVLATFVMPVLNSLAKDERHARGWPPGGPWS